MRRRRSDFKVGINVSLLSILLVAVLAGGQSAPVTEELPPSATQPASRPSTVEMPSSLTQPASRPSTGDMPDGWFAPQPAAAERPQLPAEVTKAFVIPVREMIRGKTFDAIRRKVIRCRAGGAELIIFDMDTWGGEVSAALDITRLLKVELDDIHTVCYVRTRAVSAGAAIAMACDQIIMNPSGKFGDCAPISFGGKLEGIEREKIETVLRKEFAESAERNGYNVALSESMVSAGREVWLVRNKATQELGYVLAKDYRGRVEIPPGVTSVPSNPQAPWELLRVIVPAGEILTLTPREAVDYGFAADIVKAPREEPYKALMEHFNVTTEPVVMTDNWSEDLVDFLTEPAVAGFLFFVALLCAYVEMHTPGFGAAGAVAILCFAVLFGSRFLVGMANWWEIALFVLGMGLLAVEIFVTPGFGIVGLAGLLCCTASLLAMLVANAPDKLPIPKTDLDWSLFADGVLALGIAFIAAIVSAGVFARFLPKTPFAGRLILTPSQAMASAQPIAVSEAPVAVGETGLIQGTCRPAGLARFGDKLLQVITEGAFIESGKRVRVVKVQGNHIVVTADEPDEA